MDERIKVYDEKMTKTFNNLPADSAVGGIHGKSNRKGNSDL